MPQAQQIILLHQAQHAFAVHRKAFPAQLRGDPAIAVMPVRQRQSLDRVPHRGFFRTRGRSRPVPVVAGPADASQRAHPLNRETALQQGTANAGSSVEIPSRQIRRSAGVLP